MFLKKEKNLTSGPKNDHPVIVARLSRHLLWAGFPSSERSIFSGLEDLQCISIAMEIILGIVHCRARLRWSRDFPRETFKSGGELTRVKELYGYSLMTLGDDDWLCWIQSIPGMMWEWHCDISFVKPLWPALIHLLFHLFNIEALGKSYTDLWMENGPKALWTWGTHI